MLGHPIACTRCCDRAAGWIVARARRDATTSLASRSACGVGAGREQLATEQIAIYPITQLRCALEPCVVVRRHVVQTRNSAVTHTHKMY